MKFLTLSFMALFVSTSVFASNISGLDSAQINEMNKCLKAEGLNFEMINRMENNHYNPIANGNTKLYHNFILNNLYAESNYDNSIIVSGMFTISGRHSFDNTIIANTTFIGDFSELTFQNACLVNVKFVKAGTIEMMKIKYQARSTKNISR